ncbi:hypothetical protein GCM10027170_32040 [Aliiglaciecola aliphaticivorans]
MFKKIHKTPVLLANTKESNSTNSNINGTERFFESKSRTLTFGKMSLLTAAIMTASIPAQVNAAEFLDGLAEVNFLAM